MCDPRSAAKPHGGAGHGGLVPWRLPGLRRGAGRGGGGVAGATGCRGGAAAAGGGRSWGCWGWGGWGWLVGWLGGWGVVWFQFLELVFVFSELESDFWCLGGKVVVLFDNFHHLWDKCWCIGGAKIGMTCQVNMSKKWPYGHTSPHMVSGQEALSSRLRGLGLLAECQGQQLWVR